MKVILPNQLSALAGIKAQVTRFSKAAGARPAVFPVFPSEFRRAVDELQKAGKRASANQFMLGRTKIVPGKGTFYWRAGTWVHPSLAGHIRRDGKPVQVMPDIAPYQTVAADVDGKRKVIGGRRQHREFLRRNGYTELGNDMPKRRVEEMPSVREDLQRAMEQGPSPEARNLQRADRSMTETALRHRGTDTRH